MPKLLLHRLLLFFCFFFGRWQRPRSLVGEEFWPSRRGAERPSSAPAPAAGAWRRFLLATLHKTFANWNRNVQAGWLGRQRRLINKQG